MENGNEHFHIFYIYRNPENRKALINQGFRVIYFQKASMEMESSGKLASP
jgi:hypothetical protein